MSDGKVLAREIAARTESRFIEIKPESRRNRKRFAEYHGSVVVAEYPSPKQSLQLCVAG